MLFISSIATKNFIYGMVKNKTIIGENAAMGSSTDYGPIPNKCLGVGYKALVSNE